MTERELTYHERAVYGTCPVCGAGHGNPCNPDMGIPLGFNINGERARAGAHLGRLNNAPRRVREVPIA